MKISIRIAASRVVSAVRAQRPAPSGTSKRRCRAPTFAASVAALVFLAGAVGGAAPARAADATSALPRSVAGVLLDFGDAPASYGTTLAGAGARHAVPGYNAATHTAPLMLGATVDVEADGIPDAAADGDDTNDVDDEDVVSALPPIALNQTSYSVSVPVVNTTGAAAQVTAWVDWNRNGTFDAAEGVTAAVAPAATSATLSWAGLSLGSTTPGTLYARLRIAPAGEIGAANATGAATAGEVEDHTLTLDTLPGDYFLSCPATTTQPPQNFTIRELWDSPGSGQIATYQTPLVGDLFGDSHPVVVVGSSNSLASPSLAGRTAKDVRIYNGATGALISTLTTETFFWSGNAAIALADVDADGQGEILLKVANTGAIPAAVRGRLIAYRNDGTVLWTSDQPYDNGVPHGGVGMNLADFNGDGIPEVYVGSQVFNARTGVRLAAAPAGSNYGCPDTTCVWGNTAAADMDGDGILELAAGSVIYKVDIANPNGAAGNTVAVWRQATGTGIGDGWTAVADIDLDGAPDVVAVRSTNGVQTGPTALFVWDARTGQVKGIQTGFGTGGSQPFIGDIDGDGPPEIVLTTANRLHAYRFVVGTGLVLKWTLVTVDGSALTTLSMFDFNSDRALELVYRDESQIRIINGAGATAVNLATLPCTSGTGTEMPVIADLDGTGEARIVTTCNDPGGAIGSVKVFATNSFPWAATRPVWNQQAYFVAHVSNDLTIPAPQLPHWISFPDPTQQCSTGVNRPLNAFQQQVTQLSAQTGCPVICVPANVGIAKQLTGESGSIAGAAEPGETLTYTITLSNTGGLDATPVSITDTLDPNVSFVSASNGGTLSGGDVLWTGLTVPAAGSLVLTVVVTVDTPLPAGVTRVTNLAYEPADGPPDCTATPTPANCVVTPTASGLSIAKSASTPAPTGTPNEYEITYVVTVRNPGGSPGTYDLADTLTFNGATVAAVTAPAYASSTGDTRTGTLGAFGAPNGGTIVSNETIAAQGVETWTYTVRYLITDAAVAQNCAIPSGGLRNSAVLGGASSGAPPAQTCSGAPNVNVLKTASVPAPTGSPNEFTLTYAVNVTNTGTLPANYDLTDTLTFNGATVTTISAPAYSSATGETRTGTLGTFTAPLGGTIVTGESLAPGAQETWTYTVTYTVTNAAVAQSCATVPGTGLRNRAELGGSLSGESATCTGAAAVTIGKSASGPAPTGNPNEYRITYLVTVDNDGSIAGTYDLSDAFTFPGATGVSVGAVSHGGADPLATTLGTLGATGGTIVTGETIAVGGNETYTYVVTLTVADPAATGTCAASGGLRNAAALGGSSSGAVATCTDIPVITIAKSATSPVATGVPNRYSVTYTVTVGNTGAAAGTYDLADTFAFAGATIDGVGPIVHGGTDPLAATLGTLTASGGTIVDDETIAAAGSETYTYTVTYTVTAPATANDCTTPANGLRNTATLSGTATGSATTCTSTPIVAIVKSIAAESGTLAGVAEPGETLTYAVTLTNSGGIAQTGYGVTDPLDPNVTFVSADNGGTLAGQSVAWSNLTVPAGGSLVLTVVVTVNDPLPAGTTTIVNSAYATGTTPPDCATSPLPPNCTSIPVPNAPLPPSLSLSKSVDRTTVLPGGTLVYTIVVANVGTVPATNAQVSDPLPAGVANFAWSCTGSGVACPNASGTGAIAETVPVLPVGASLTYVVNATLAAAPPATIVNAATVTPSGIATCAPGGTTPPCAASAVSIVLGSAPLPVPALDGWLLSLVALALVVVAMRTRWRLR